MGLKPQVECVENAYSEGMRNILLALLLFCPFAVQAVDGPTEFGDFLRDAYAWFERSFAAARTSSAARPPADDARCRPETAEDVKLYSNAFRWDYSLAEMKAAYEKTYASAARLPLRAYWNVAAGRYEVPYMGLNGGPVPLPESFVRAVARHITAALKAGYIDAVFFPDMGHSHFYIPEAHWKAKYEGFLADDRFAALYAELFKDPKLKVLYHTAEGLTTREKDGRLVADPRTRFRYETRNIVGVNSAAGGLEVHTNPESRANSVREIAGHKEWSTGFNISANERGCFAFEHKGQTIRFDLSIHDLPPAPGTGTGM